LSAERSRLHEREKKTSARETKRGKSQEGGVRGSEREGQRSGGRERLSKKLVLAPPTVVPIQLAVPIQTTLNKTHGQMYAHAHSTRKDLGLI